MQLIQLLKSSILIIVYLKFLCTDARGGGTREGLAVELDKLSRTISLLLLMIVTCVLCAMNRMMQSPCEKFLGSSRVSSRNCMQLLHTCYALQKEYELKE